MAFMIKLAPKGTTQMVKGMTRQEVDIMGSMDMCGLPLFSEYLPLPSNRGSVSCNAYGTG